LIADVVAEEIDLLVIGGGVAGYVAAIKAGQEGLKVILFKSSATTSLIMSRLPV
jgi:dihydrolipoamide dehydrogenase